VKELRELVRGLFAATLLELDTGNAMAPVLERYRDRAARGERFLVLAYGKAARGMAAAVVAQLPGAALRGLVVVPEPDEAPLPPFEVIAGGHPLPTEGSLRAGQRALELARSVTADETVLFLASGGGSAMLEWPLVDGVALDELRTFHRALVGSGATILAMNAIRQRVSAVKGGRLALAAAHAREHVTIVISDVFDGFSSYVASGPSTGELDFVHSRHVLDEANLWPSVPAALREPLRADTLPRGVRGRLTSLPTFTADVLDNRMACNLMADLARKQHLAPLRCIDVDEIDQDDLPLHRAASHLVHQLERLHRRWPGRRVAVIAGGEVSVPLPENPGIGGRNQQFVLACARLIRGRPITVLSAGTDGVDGNSPAAGAIADGTTLARARALGFDVHDALRACDAFPLFDALGDTIVTGPTGTNVRDLRLLVHA
jgi:hydroxypyruvate reductase